MFEININIPNTIYVWSQALEPQAHSTDLACHILAIHAVRKAFIIVESSEKLKFSAEKSVKNYQFSKILGQDGPVLLVLSWCKIC